MNTLRTRALMLGLTLTVGLAPLGAAWAEKPDWAGGGGRHEERDRDHRRDERHGRDDRRDDRRERGPEGGLVIAPATAPVSISVGAYFGAPQRQAVRTYYAPQIESGRCPPGLAKKHNGCLPPGQERKWRMGERMPAGIVSYPVPVELRAQLGVPPAGYNYVRVGADILMIAVGTGMVVDAIQDLAR